MREKTADSLYGFCIGVGGMCIALLYRVDVVSLFAVFLFCFVMWLFYRKTDFTQSAVLCVGALLSAAVSVFVGCDIVCRFALDNTFLPICVFLGCCCAVALALSNTRALKSVAFVIAVVCIFFISLILLLCIAESDFSKEKIPFTPNRIVFPMVVFSVTDSFFIMPYVKKKNRFYYLLGNSFMPFYMFVTVVVALFALSLEIFDSLDTPIVKLWQTCYVLSFVDRFETLIICVLFAVCIVKAGILLKTVLDFYSKMTVLLFFGFTVLLFAGTVLLYIFAALTLICIISYYINKKIC